MAAVTVLVPDETLEALDLAAEEMAEDLRLSTAMRLYDQRRLCSGAATAQGGPRHA